MSKRVGGADQHIGVENGANRRIAMLSSERKGRSCPAQCVPWFLDAKTALQFGGL